MSPMKRSKACDPQLAYQAYLRNTDIPSLIPCSAVVREVAPGKISLELMKPLLMMEILGDRNPAAFSQDGERD